MKFFSSTHADSLLFQTRSHHMQLSSMADVKASMLITMSSIVLTLCVPRVQRHDIHWPLIVLMTSCLVTILLAAYAVMPKFSSRRHPPTPEERAQPRFNVLFFGDFSMMSYADFKQDIEAALVDPDKSYEVQLREIHSLGIFLAKTKYRYLRFAYLSLMFGLVGSFLTLLALGVK